MKKTRNSFSLTIILTMMLLACLLMVSLGSTGAWFSATGSVLKFQINLSGADIYVYQTLNGNDVKLDASEQSYITLDQEIAPGEEVPLILKVKNNELAGTYLRFKFDVFALGQENVSIPVSLNLDMVSENNNGFFQSAEGDEYWIYEQYISTNDDGSINCAPVTMTGELELISGFTIEESDFIEKQLNGNTIKIVLTVECSDINWYA